MRILLTIDSKERLPLVAEMFTKFIPLFKDELLFIDLFHCYEPPVVNAPYMKTREEIMQQREERRKVEAIASIENYIENYLKLNIDKAVLVNSHLKIGSPVEEIKKQSEALDYDLVVLTPIEKDALTMMFNGSVSAKLMDLLDKPMLVLPKTNADIKPESKFVFLVEKKEDLDKATHSIFNLIDKKDISYLHFQVGNEKMDDSIEVMESNNIVNGIAAYNGDQDYNCIYILHHATQKGLLSRFTSSSLSKKLMHKTNAPLLVLHKQA